MGCAVEDKIDSVELSNKMFNRFSTFVERELGIKMPEVKKTLLQGRIHKRMRKVGIPTFEEYYEYVFSEEGRKKELTHMVDSVTTNKTDFFREPKHFEYLVQSAIPYIMNCNGRFSRSHIKLWSAGCSSGQEPYTLAMVLSDFARQHQGIQFSVLATDISTKVLNSAMLGIYDESDMITVPAPMRKRYMMRSKDKSSTKVRITPELRAKVMFRQLNFMHEDYCIGDPVDIIFFRNVLIYFSRQTQERVINRLCAYLKSDGYFFAGHSETLSGLKVPLIQTGPTIYKRK